MRAESTNFDQRHLAVGDLVRCAGAGDFDAWNELVNRFAGMVWTVARRHRLNAADAADVSQTTWLRLVEQLNRIEHPERVGGWLATTARRESLRVLRLADRQVPTAQETFLDLTVPDSASPEDVVAN
jgi:RNA polymerase sigma factor (sigma-70 family)